MIDLTILGRLDVRDAEGLSIAELCSRPKTAALLVYLAVARPRGFHAQDALLATFWPEADTARAQLSLRQSLHLLRRFLGDEVVLLGRQGKELISAEEIAAKIGTINYEVFCAVSSRVPRVYESGGQVVVRSRFE